MANIITLFEPKPTFTMLAGLPTITIVELHDVYVLETGRMLVFDDLVDAYALTGTSPVNFLAITELKDTYLVSGLTGEKGEIAFIELLPIFSLATKPGVIGSLAYTERLDEILVAGLTGNMGSIVIIDSSHARGVWSLTALLPAVGSMIITDLLDGFWLHGVEVPITFIRKAVVMNLFNYAVSEYKNLNFNSLVQFNGYTIGINEQGAFILEGPDDLGQLIQARLKSGVEDLAKGGILAIPREAWLAYRSDDGMQLDVRVDEYQDLLSLKFGKVATGIREHRTKFGRGIKGRFFSWDVKNISGSDFSLESLRILGDRIKRKTR